MSCELCPSRNKRVPPSKNIVQFKLHSGEVEDEAVKLMKQMESFMQYMIKVTEFFKENKRYERED